MNQPSVDKTNVDKTNGVINKLLIAESLWMLVEMEIDECSKS